MNISVFDYGAGNLHSLVKVLAGDGRTVHVDSDAREAIRRDFLVLPGVGAFGPAAAALAPARASVMDALKDGLPCFGICLGMQLLFERSDEGPGTGLGFFGGSVAALDARRTPQIGWNSLDDTSDPLFVRSGFTTAYFANGFVARPNTAEDVVAWATHESDRFPAAVRRDNVFGVQFHPEKSSAPGVHFVRNLLAEMAP
jgi:glutamine amidotransferase